jgi:putative transposase
MPPKARRHQLAGSLVFHAYNRTNNRAPLFRTAEDYAHFIDLLHRYTGSFLLSIHHWVLMRTHFHLLLKMADPREISSFMAGLDRAYTHYHHRVHQTSGLLWQGRFGLQPVQIERSLLACARYIERNPVRAHYVSHAWEYPYSSARLHCLGIPDPVTVKTPLWERFGADTARRMAGYISYLCDFDAEEEMLFRNNPEPVGDDDFRSRIQSIGGRLQPGTRGAPRGVAIGTN